MALECEMDSRFPAEIWLMVANLLPKEDLSRLCLASQQLLRLVRPIIYGKFEVDTDNPSTSSFTLPLLASNKGLAESVKSLYLYTYCPEVLDAIPNMSNSKYLMLGMNDLFPSADQQKLFSQILSMHISSDFLPVVHFTRFATKTSQLKM